MFDSLLNVSRMIPSRSSSYCQCIYLYLNKVLDRSVTTVCLLLTKRHANIPCALNTLKCHRIHTRWDWLLILLMMTVYNFKKPRFVLRISFTSHSHIILCFDFCRSSSNGILITLDTVNKVAFVYICVYRHDLNRSSPSPIRSSHVPKWTKLQPYSILSRQNGELLRCRWLLFFAPLISLFEIYIKKRQFTPSVSCHTRSTAFFFPLPFNIYTHVNQYECAQSFCVFKHSE